jgi:molybdate transport system substrate-binding protein
MPFRPACWILCCAALLTACGEQRHLQPASKLTVAAAANLTDVFSEIGGRFKAKTGLDVIFSYGPTAALAQQIENGAPFDLFAAADTEHIDALVSRGKLTGESRAVYALGQLALWIPDGERNGVRELRDLPKQQVRFIAIAQPALAPYGQATIEVLKNAGLWDATQPKLVYANSISMAKQMAATGNAEVAFTAYSLVLGEKGIVVKVDPSLYRPIQQALAIVSSSERVDEAKQFRSFLLGPEGRAILAERGYLLP